MLFNQTVVHKVFSNFLIYLGSWCLEAFWQVSVQIVVSGDLRILVRVIESFHLVWEKIWCLILFKSIHFLDLNGSEFIKISCFRALILLHLWYMSIILLINAIYWFLYKCIRVFFATFVDLFLHLFLKCLFGICQHSLRNHRTALL